MLSNSCFRTFFVVLAIAVLGSGCLWNGGAPDYDLNLKLVSASRQSDGTVSVAATVQCEFVGNGSACEPACVSAQWFSRASLTNEVQEIDGQVDTDGTPIFEGEPLASAMACQAEPLAWRATRRSTALVRALHHGGGPDGLLRAHQPRIA